MRPTFQECAIAAARAGAIDPVQVAAGIFAATQKRHKTTEALAKLRHWQPALFRATRNEPAPPNPPYVPGVPSKATLFKAAEDARNHMQPKLRGPNR